MKNALFIITITYLIFVMAFPNKDMIVYRIKYLEVGGGIHVSQQTIQSKTTKAQYVVKFNTNDMTYEIVNVNRVSTKIRGGEGVNSLRVLKKHIRKRLQELGVEFRLEVKQWKKHDKK